MSVDAVLKGESRFHVVLGDDVQVLPTLPPNSVDAVVTDPPCGIAFMAKEWDTDKGGRDAWIAWMAGIAQECLRVTKPGGHAVVWALPRTSHWTAMAWENAGWEVREKCTHLNSEGFPKSHDIAKAIAKRAGGALRAQEAIRWMQSERERQGLSRRDLEMRIFGRCDGNVRNWEDSISIPRPGLWPQIRQALGYDITPFDADMERGDVHTTTVAGSFGYQHNGQRWEKDREIRVPATDLAKQWGGWGTGLKPASEDWWILRKPCDQPTVAQNVLTHGTGALNIDGTRVATNPNDPILESKIAAGRGFGVNARVYGKPGSGAPAYDPSKGRHPANLVVSHTMYCTPGSCYPGCQVTALDRQSGYTASVSGGVAGWQDQYVGGELAHPVERTGYDDAGGASRFFNTFRYEADDLPDHESFIYTPKPSQSERHEGLPDGGNEHPTVKSRALMLHWVTLVCPPGGVVLDPFTGSGSTGVAAMYHSPETRFIGVEMDPTYHGIATARISYHLTKSRGGVPNPFTEDAPVTVEPPATLNSMDDLFGF